MKADIHTLFYSPLFTVIDFRCRSGPGEPSELEWNRDYSISFTRRGNFAYKIGGQHYDVHSGVVLLENAETEYSVSHDHHVKDECTSITIHEELPCTMVKAFADDAHNYETHDVKNMLNFPSVVTRSTPQLECFHRQIYQMTSRNQSVNSLEVDTLIIDFLQSLFTALYGSDPMAVPVRLDKRLKNLHLETIDRGKRYILDNFQKELHLTDIAQHACVSPFYFSRLFKHFTSYSPHQYLLSIRLSHAAMLFRNTSDSVTTICFESGFNSLEHFIASFKRRHGVSPLRFRRCHSTKE